MCTRFSSAVRLFSCKYCRFFQICFGIWEDIVVVVLSLRTVVKHVERFKC